MHRETTIINYKFSDCEQIFLKGLPFNNMIAIFFICLNLIVPIVYAQEYNPTSDVYDGIINVIIPLLVVAAYTKSSDKKLKDIIGRFEVTILFLFLFFPPIYNFFIYKSTSIYDYVCMISSFIFSLIIILVIFITPMLKIRRDNLEDLGEKWYTWFIFIICFLLILPMITFAYAIYWIRKDNISKKIGYGWFIASTTAIFIIVFIICLRRRIILAIYFYWIITIGMSFSIGYSNNYYFTKLSLGLTSYILGRMFDNNSMIGKTIKSADKFTGGNETMLSIRFYIEQADRFHDQEIEFTIGDESKSVTYVGINCRGPHYIHKIDHSLHDQLILIVNVNGKEDEYYLGEIKVGMLVQTHELLDGIVLTFVILDDKSSSKSSNNNSDPDCEEYLKISNNNGNLDDKNGLKSSSEIDDDKSVSKSSNDNSNLDNEDGLKSSNDDNNLNSSKNTDNNNDKQISIEIK